MKITVLDRDSLGLDTPLSALSAFGEVEVFAQTPRELLFERVKDAEIIVLNKVKLDREALLRAEKLRLVCVFATGFDNIDVKTARERGVAVCNVPGYSTDSVALFTMANVLSLYTHLYEYNGFVRTGAYSASGSANRLTPVYHELSGKTFGILGYGNIGKAVGRVAEAFGANVIVCKRTPVPDAVCVDIDTLCRESDIITLHCPLNEGTRGIINRDRLAMMKPSAILVNEARGAVTDEAAVADAVLSGQIAGFGSDVYSAEPFPTDHPFSKIKDLPNVCLTPHAAWGAYEARERCIGIIAENIEAFLQGKIKNRVDI